METKELRQMLDERDTEKAKAQTATALVVVLAVIPCAVVALLLTIRFLQNL